uniref:Uncharacterized protein AlNc14C61G4468 n=1 Tax=Albugo laibachii Nc14 TaxID=890382 RepID=F0WCU2_9STRA|nr:conserved hypothetical protein [Albugo laibachii Nc14]|eukprot:CCA19011.1 conserved hypothetical protein [Albugo laibachii Nc14]
MATKRVSKNNLEKREVVEWIEGTGGGVPTRALKNFQWEREWKVLGAQIRYWWRNRVAITKSPALQLRVTGEGGHPRFGEVEDVLFDQILFLRAKKKKISRQWIQASAHELAHAELDEDDFSASDMWLAHFMDRYGLSLRRTTNLTKLSDDELTARAVHFLAYLS